MSDPAVPAPAIEPDTPARVRRIGKIRRKNARKACLRRWYGSSVSALGLAATVVAVIYNWPVPDASAAGTVKPVFSLADHRILFVVFFAWTFCPPLWHALEWMLFAPQRLSEAKIHEDLYKQDIEDFKYSQALSRNIWLALLATLAVLYGINKSI